VPIVYEDKQGQLQYSTLGSMLAECVNQSTTDECANVSNGSFSLNTNFLRDKAERCLCPYTFADNSPITKEDFLSSLTISDSAINQVLGTAVNSAGEVVQDVVNGIFGIVG